MDDDDTLSLLRWLLARHGERYAALCRLRESREALSPEELLQVSLGLQEQAEIDLGSLLLLLLPDSGTQETGVQDNPDAKR